MTDQIAILKAKLPEDARHFVDFPEVIFFDEFRDHLVRLEGLDVIEFELDGVVSVWMEFDYRDQRFFVDNGFGDYRLFVGDPECPEEILIDVAAHLRVLLEPSGNVDEISDREM